ncbi:MAG TPA: non-canonical purine NTP pyrophosphatase [Candidatus Saccharibacteria bacterium]|jgi:inosine triphosphate pyrophosphatase|nr:non-canonical purine NTP pyrophosphatase [Candidatus Saccharibacteria bacterium]
MKDFIFITGNQHKLKWLEKFIGYRVESADIDLDEIQSLDQEKIVKDKAVRAYQFANKAVLIEDVSLKFNALSGLPGPFIKWFLKSLGEEGTYKILSSFEDKTATAEVVYCLYDGDQFRMFQGVTAGKIVNPVGNFGHGWDPLFMPEGSDKSFGEMNEVEYSKYSPRNKAVAKLKEFLEGN